MQNELALIVIYNHKYDKNIETIEKIYGSKFSNIYHLVPFYNGDKENVIPVYETSYNFQGYIAQGFKHFFKVTYKHYFFIADDMVLNPIINEGNYKEIFNLDDESGFLPELDSMPSVNWPHNRRAVTYDPNKAGVEIKAEIPSVQEAEKMINKLNVVNGSYSIKQTYFWDKNYSLKNISKQIINYLYDKVILKTNYKKSKYPFVLSYSDIAIVSATNAKKFTHYCGVFAATDLWVELAIPTAMALCGDKIVVQKDLSLKGRPLWTSEDYKLLDTFEYKLNSLLEYFPKDYIYLHPIKLSKWDTDLE